MPKYGIDYKVDVVREYIDKIEFGKDAIAELGYYPELSSDLNKIVTAEIRTLSHLMSQYEDTIRDMDPKSRNDKYKLDARTLGLRFQNVDKSLSKADGFDRAMKVVTKSETVFKNDPKFLNEVIGEGFGSVVKFYIEDLKKISCSMDDLKLELSSKLMDKIPSVQKDYYMGYKIEQAEEAKKQLEEEKKKLTFEKYEKILKNIVSILDSDVEYVGKEDDRAKMIINMQKLLSECMLAYSHASAAMTGYERQKNEDELARMLNEAGVREVSAKKRARNLLNDPYIDADDIEYVKANMGRQYMAVVEFFGKVIESYQMVKILKGQDLDLSDFMDNANRKYFL